MAEKKLVQIRVLVEVESDDEVVVDYFHSVGCRALVDPEWILERLTAAASTD